MKEITLLDVTLRDGGYVNGHSWTRSRAQAVVAACDAAGVPYCEIGYFRPGRHETDGARLPAACCPPDYLDDLRTRFPGVALVVMVHPRDVSITDYRVVAELGVAVVRFPVRHDTLSTSEPHIAAAREAGLRVTLNLIRASEVEPGAVAEAAVAAESFGANVFYLADSNGSLFPAQVATLLTRVAETTGITLGFHAHDGLSLAFINSLTALDYGCRYLDASIGGVGKGGGNLALELIVGYLRTRQQAPFSMTPLAREAPTVISGAHRGQGARCESMVSGLLDLNLEDIQTAQNAARELVSLVDTEQDDFWVARSR
jgi:4-hydroxy 2-oxovalerate aldolase